MVGVGFPLLSAGPLARHGLNESGLTAMVLMSGILPSGRNPMLAMVVLSFECPGTGGTWS